VISSRWLAQGGADASLPLELISRTIPISACQFSHGEERLAFPQAAQSSVMGDCGNLAQRLLCGVSLAFRAL
jgi:hypothetical protein